MNLVADVARLYTIGKLNCKAPTSFVEANNPPSTLRVTGCWADWNLCLSFRVQSRPPDHFLTVVIVALSELLLVLGSAVVALAEAVLMILVPPATPLLMRASRVIVADEPEDSDPKVVVTLLP